MTEAIEALNKEWADMFWVRAVSWGSTDVTATYIRIICATWNEEEPNKGQKTKACLVLLAQVIFATLIRTS